VDWYRTVFELIDMRSFSNLWYWIALGVLWSTASHWVLGVPFDMITRARRLQGAALEDLEVMVRINCERLLYISRTAGLWLVAVACFVLTALVTLGFFYDVEFAQALLFILFPMLLLGGMSVRTAGMIEAGENRGAALFRRLGRHRLSTQLLGMVSILVTSMYGMWQNITIGFNG
jgi:hypothetical protein